MTALDTEKRARELDGRRVNLTLVNGETREGVLTGVGYQGLRILLWGEFVERSVEFRLISAIEPATSSEGERDA